MSQSEKAKLYQMPLTPAQAGTVGSEMNITLRNPSWSLAAAEAFNVVFRSIFGEDHESMERRREAAAR